MYSSDFIIGIDIGGTNFRIGIVSMDGKLEHLKKENSSMFAVDEDPLKHLAVKIREFIDGTANGMPKAIALGFPSPVSKDKRIAYSPHNVGTYTNLKVVETLEEEFGIPIFLDRDVNYLLAWDINCLCLPMCSTILGFYIGTGFGNSIFINGEFWSGKSGTAGELGHIPVLNSKETCSCGNIGCIEMYASGKRLNLIMERYFPETDISKIFTYHGSSEVIQEYIDWLSIPIATEMNILDPDYVVIGGGVINMENFPCPALEECIKEHLRKPYPFKEFNALYSKQNHESGVLGAAHQALKELQVCRT